MLNIRSSIRTICFQLSLDFFSLKTQLSGRDPDWQQLEHLCRKHLKKDPADYSAQYHLAKALYNQELFEESAKMYEKLVKHPNSDYFVDTCGLLWALLDANWYENGILVGEEALTKLNQTNIDKYLKKRYLDTVHRVIGACYVELEQYYKALPHLEAGYKINICKHPDKLLERINFCRQQLGLETLS